MTGWRATMSRWNWTTKTTARVRRSGGPSKTTRASGPPRTYRLGFHNNRGGNDASLLRASGPWVEKIAAGDAVKVTGTIKSVGYQGESDPLWSDSAADVRIVDFTIILDPVLIEPAK